METAKSSNPRSGASYSALRLLRTVLPWGESTFRNRFFLTLVLLLAAALLNATVPNFFAAAVDVFSGGPAWAVAPATILAAYVFTYWLSKMFNEARWMLYGPIEQRAQHTMALRCVPANIFCACHWGFTSAATPAKSAASWTTGLGDYANSCLTRFF